MAKKKLIGKQLVKDLQKRMGDLEGNWKRALADYQNLEQRMKQQQGEMVKFANAGLIDKLLGVLDDLERAAEHQIKNDGVRLIRDHLRDILRSEGVSRIEAETAEFDPDMMDCAGMAAGSKNKVVAVLVPGYQWHGKVIRPAKVTVGKGG